MKTCCNYHFVFWISGSVNVRSPNFSVSFGTPPLTLSLGTAFEYLHQTSILLVTLRKAPNV